ncbi:hypothetical protein TH53_19795 [Pedobacter lusitanus]|uniref:Contig93, whole genome shotgun sequence n=1 Tax=Pedobacter lusitanus TaxID=1503925 RepID=A0A0D0FT08_9SPHI|nr:phage portal protein [Pedobacter lusitanus]KIO75584.1 hypothetical protein TH53_19795 [Pedobacter lusitanus]
MNWIQKSIANFTGLDKFVNPIFFESYSSRFVDPITDFNEIGDDLRKVALVFANPAVLKVFSLQCNMFALGKMYVYQNGKALKSDPFLDLIKRPNPFQQESQFKWDYMFWKMIGNAYCYGDSKIVTNEGNKLYFLDSSKMVFPEDMLKQRDRIILSKSSIETINNYNIAYNYKYSPATSFKWGNIIHVPDLTNGTGDWFRGHSKLTALYKIISNSDTALDSKNINVRYSGKFLVAGTADPSDVNKLPLSNDEKLTIETKINGHKNVHAIKSMIDIKRFVDNIGNLKLDESYLADYFLIGSMYDIPKEVLEANLQGATFENQEKSRGAHVSYSLQPSGDQLCGELERFFGYTDKSIVIDWEHLPFMQAFAKERAETEKIKTESLLNLMRAGVKIPEINTILDLELTHLDYASAQRTAGQNNRNT